MKKLIIVLVVVAGGYLLWAQPWKPKRYNDTPQGKEAARIDDHVQQAIDWKDPTGASWWSAKDYIGTKQEKGRYFGSLGGWASANKFTNDMLQAGAKDVRFINIKRSVRTGDAPEGIVVVLPDGPAARAPIFTAFAKYMAADGKSAPPDVNQKYLYYGFGVWSPEGESPGWLPS
jgi:hypothetical protein